LQAIEVIRDESEYGRYRRPGLSGAPRGQVTIEAPAILTAVISLFLIASFLQIQLLIQLKIGVVVLILTLLGMTFSRNWQWTKFHTAMTAYLFLVVVSITYANNYYTAYRSSLGYFGFIVVAFGIAWVMSGPRGARLMTGVWFLVLACVGGIGILSGGIGPGGYVGDENDFAMTAAIGLSLALFGAESKSRGIRFIAISASVLFVTAIILSFSRGGFVALVAVALFYLSKTANRGKKVGLLMLGFVLMFALAPNKFVSEVGSIRADATANSASSTGTIRLFMWTTAVNAAADNPLFGVGAGNFPGVVGKYQPKSGNWPPSFFRRDRSTQAAHSFYFKLLAEHGLIGILIVGYLIRHYFSVLSAIAGDTKNAHNEAVWGYVNPNLLAKGLMGSMVGFLTAGLFLSVLMYPHFFYLLGMGAGLQVAYTRVVSSGAGQSEDRRPALGAGA
jgi:O-antigen ligase